MSERANEKIRIVLQNILDKHLLGIEYPVLGIGYTEQELTADRDNHYLDDENEPTVSESDLLPILEQFSEKEIIEGFKLEDGKYYCWIDFPQDFRLRAQKHLKTLNGDATSTNQFLYLDSDGNIWHGDKSLCSYKFPSKGSRLKLFKYLIDNNDGNFIDTEIIAGFFEKKTQNIRSELGKIRNKIESELGVEMVIENEPHNGYRINPKYKIVSV